MSAFVYGDLLRLEYEHDQLDVTTGRTNCVGVCREVLRRGGFDPSILPATPDDASRQLREPRRGWDLVGVRPKLARELGDTILSLTSSGSHVHTVVQESPPRAISAAARSGVYTISPSMVQGAIGVWRPRKATAE